MNSSNNLNAGQKALSTKLVGLAVVVVLIALIGLFIQKFTATGGGFKDYQRSVKLASDINAVHANLYKIRNMAATSQDKQELAKISDQQIAALDESVNLVKKTLDSGIGDDQKRYYQAIMDNLVEYQKSAAQVIRLAPMNTGTAYLSVANEKIDAINQLLNQLLDFEGNLAEKGSGSSLIFYVIVILLIVLLVVFIIIIPSSIKKMIESNVAEPLQETSGVLREFASGKYSRSLSWDADDAIGELVQAVNALRSKMSAPAPAQKATQEPAPAAKAAAPEPVAPAPDDKTKSLSDMIKKTPEAKGGEQLVTSSKKAIDKLQDI